jgi:segregation and condensation protein A
VPPDRHPGVGYRRGVHPRRLDDPAAAGDAAQSTSGFTVHLAIFEGPFDLLLSLIAKRQLDVTLVALAQVTDEFIAHIRARGDDWDLDQASGFLVVAATLLDLKVARLLPSAQVEDEEDLALLEARDLLFARLLQYRAFKQIAALFAQRFADEGRRYPRQVPMEPAFTALLPEVLLGVSPEQFASAAARAMTPKPRPAVGLDHLHAPKVSVSRQSCSPRASATAGRRASALSPATPARRSWSSRGSSPSSSSTARAPLPSTR